MATVQLAFAGTPDFAVPSLAAVVGAGYAVSCVLTQPDRPAGRGRQPQASPVKQFALANGLPVRQPERLDNPSQADSFGPRPALLIVVAYGLLLPPWMLRWPALGAVNVHASLLPRWRGAAPIQRALLAGDALTGVSIMQMDQGLDTGPVHARAELPVPAGATAALLHDRLAELGAATLLGCLEAILSGGSSPVAQPAEGITYARKISKAEAVIDWTCPAVDLERRIRAFISWPVAESTLSDGRRIRIWEAEVVPDLAPAQSPGSIIAAGSDGIVVATGQGGLRLTRIQPPGARVMTVADYLAGKGLDGVRFGA